jgi:hypothetical protein
MKKFILATVTLSVAAFALSVLSPSAAIAQARKGAKSSTDTYIVVKVTDENKPEISKIEFKVVSASQYKEEEKRIKDLNKKLHDEWKDLLLNDPQSPKPATVTIKKMKAGYLTQKIAQEYADKLKDELLNKDSNTKPAAKQ